MKQKFFVEIAGVRLGIVSEEGKEYVENIAKAVNDRINQMVKNQRNCSLVEASIFCAMDFYSSAESDARKVKNLEAQIALYQANVNRLKKENEELRTKLSTANSNGSQSNASYQSNGGSGNNNSNNPDNRSSGYSNNYGSYNGGGYNKPNNNSNGSGGFGSNNGQR